VARKTMLWMGCACMLAISACDRDDYAALSDQEKIGANQTPAGSEAAGAYANTKDFVQKAAGANAAEVQLGELATQRAESPEVKQFAQMMVTDHTKAQQELMTAASGASISNELDRKHRQIYDRLSSLQGKAFDREYMKAMVQGHKDVAAMLERRTTTTHDRGAGAADEQNASVNEWAEKTLPSVKAHLEQAQKISAKL